VEGRNSISAWAVLQMAPRLLRPRLATRLATATARPALAAVRRIE